MIPRECKRLAEVDFPIAEVSKHAVREKKPQKGHPSKLHPWWARRPLASCRAVLIALLLPDPCDPHCPATFKEDARRVLLNMANRPTGWSEAIESDEGLRQIILEFIADFADGSKAVDPFYLSVSRSLIKAAHEKDIPLVVDPFAGGGSIPLEALRLGCDAFASDLNPVACLILQVMLENIPRYGEQLSKGLHKIGEDLNTQIEQSLEGLYPKDFDGAVPSVYLWARTIRCEAPNCGAEIPLIRSFWLCKKANRKTALRYSIEHPEGLPPRVEFEVFEPESDKQVPIGTVTRATATCICCDAVLAPERVREQLKTQKGGADVIFNNEGCRIGGARMIAVVTLRPGQKGRHYRIPNDTDYAAVHKSQERLDNILCEWEVGGKQELCPVPNESLPLMSGTFNVPLYGIAKWGDLFTARQKVALIEIAKSIRNVHCSNSLRTLIAFSLSIFARSCNGNARLRPDSTVAPAFGMQALPITWTFPETVPFGGRSEHFDGALSNIIRTIEAWPLISAGQVQLADAADHPLPDQSANVWFTDPPYYFAIPYADLSDFFFVWLKRALPHNPLLRDPFDQTNKLTPKGPELCEMARWDSERYSHKDQKFFEDGMSLAFSEGQRVLRDDGVASVVFAHKTTEGWEALLSGMIRGGWTITGSWPIATESSTRLRARESAALATSIHLICRPRLQDAPIGDWRDVLRELPRRVSSWMSRLQGEGIRGADLVFACIGPALEIFSRYRTVETAEGHEVKLSEYLEKVWEIVGRTALEQVLGISKSSGGLTGTLEEDARLTALFLWTLQSTESSQKASDAKEEDGFQKNTLKGFTLPFDVVRRFAQPMGIDLNAWTGSIIALDKGIVRLLPVIKRDKDLFGKDGIDSTAEWIEHDRKGNTQTSLFPELDTEFAPEKHHSRKKITEEDLEFQSDRTTVLDRVHAAMLLQTSGHTDALRTFIDSEMNRGPEFLHLANALSALYPRGCQEKRLIDAMLLAVPR